jgi:nickel-dependent lactate racemase
MNISLKYGRTSISLPVPELAAQLAFNEPTPDVSEKEFIRNLENLIGNSRITGNVAIVVADKTRLCGYDRILPWSLQSLKNKGVTAEQICFYIAYGTHPRQSDDECLAAYGAVYSRFRFIHHDCSDEECFAHLGTTTVGTDVKVRKDAINSELIITIGTVSHHYFAGYGGGRKLLFPGLAEKKAIFSNHRLFLDRERMQLAAGCWPGNLDGNPLAGDLKEIHDMLPDYVSIHAILDSSGAPANYYFGRSYEDFLSVCTELDECYKIKQDERFDLVLASAGGYPKDINMIQSHKSIHNAANLVRDGGTLIMLAECFDGIGSKTFLPYFEMGSRDAAFSELVEHYVGNGGTALAMMEKTERIRICLVTTLPEEICTTINTEKITAEEAGSIIKNNSGKTGIVQNGSLLVADRCESG